MIHVLSYCNVVWPLGMALSTFVSKCIAWNYRLDNCITNHILCWKSLISWSWLVVTPSLHLESCTDRSVLRQWDYKYKTISHWLGSCQIKSKASSAHKPNFSHDILIFSPIIILSGTYLSTKIRYRNLFQFTFIILLKLSHLMLFTSTKTKQWIPCVA